MNPTVTPALVIERCKTLPAFPRLLSAMLECMDDDKFSLRLLTEYAEHDPVFTGKLFAYVNAAGIYALSRDAPRDVFTAISMIGLVRVRQLAMVLSASNFIRSLPPGVLSGVFWEHSVSVGVCARVLTRKFVQHGVSVDYALIGGLLHDVGQLWLAANFPDEMKQVREAVEYHGADIIEAESAMFDGMDHAAVGAILAGHWGLPDSVVGAIRHHHRPAAALPDALMATVHVAEVVSNALDLPPYANNHVAHLSSEACALLGIDWSEDHAGLFGEMEARAGYACAIFR